MNMHIRQALFFGIAAMMMGLTGGVFGEASPKLPSDAEIPQKVTGVWEYAGTSSTNVIKVARETYSFGEKGELTKEVIFGKTVSAGKAFSSGTWEVKDGAIVTTVTKTAIGGGEVKETRKPYVSHMKVISLTDHELVVRTEKANSLMALKRRGGS